jgi:phosphoribosylglycinamide formyltransferase-1
MVNIHPALLPKFGGEGMYGQKVHEAVLQSGDAETGISVHYINKNFDEGEIIYQSRCPVDKNDDAEKLAYKVHQLEHLHYPKIIEELLKKLDKKLYPRTH